MHGGGRPLIGMLAGRREAGEDIVVGQNADYFEAIAAAGGIGMALDAETLAADDLPGLCDLFDGILLTGGADIDPARYGEEKLEPIRLAQPSLDAAEIHVARAALSQDLPVLGICRGMQVMAVAAGGTLWQEIPRDVPGSLDHRPGPAGRHVVSIDPASRLAEIAGSLEVVMNSHHHQAVRSVAEPLRLVAWAPDGVPEALEAGSHRFAVAVQSHPESLCVEQPWARRLFEAFVEAAQSA